MTNPGPAAPESETPLVERLKDAGWNESSCRSAFDEAIYAGAPIWACEQIQEIAELCTEAATALSLAQTEIKGHMRLEIEAQADYIRARELIEQQSKRIAELEKDAARYRWLREHFRFSHDNLHELWFDENVSPHAAVTIASREELDATIDEAALKSRA